MRSLAWTTSMGFERGAIMICTFVLLCLLAIIFYCAFAGSARAGEFAGTAGRTAERTSHSDLRARREFIPGSMAVLRSSAQPAVTVLLGTPTAETGA